MVGKEKEFQFHLGRTAAGKDTQAGIILKKFGDIADQISTGDIYRGAKSRVGEYAKYYPVIEKEIGPVSQGILLKDETIATLLGGAIKDHYEKGKRIFIITGFPRTVEQLRFADKLVEGHKTFFFLHDACEETCRDRGQIRVLTDVLKGKKPREEDTGTGFTKKLKEFDEKTLPMINLLKERGQLLYIDAEGSINKIHKAILQIIKRERKA